MWYNSFDDRLKLYVLYVRIELARTSCTKWASLWTMVELTMVNLHFKYSSFICLLGQYNIDTSALAYFSFYVCDYICRLFKLLDQWHVLRSIYRFRRYIWYTCPHFTLYSVLFELINTCQIKHQVPGIFLNIDHLFRNKQACLPYSLARFFPL